MKYIKTLEKENMFGRKTFFMIEIKGDFDLKNCEFDSFNDAMEYMTHNYEDSINNFGTDYKIYEMQKKLVSKDMFIRWENQNKYNL